ncbi:lysophospholipase D GDPD1-like [Haliotis rubra]|uniref:lysophospholipase D GDPD1-like n=1 Tax=Haliotis rubra TaxID=36100 RepID=UPI001EE53281|nr:lysophospholipase D GDPD1-like [Haliotis rubra]XP_046549098.1 lysophospholipase D GDPD1-like [Haliotis rubra]XP_046549099.1 lysophospholipase D GDPD1-like [Haliotis rubra]XP_046549100.1 lysophospholipase D GDPD1-like [Haliotis rubra]XP_046549101.1 lysophospholipase D GDPD1-like [Haliotis rubra]
MAEWTLPVSLTLGVVIPILIYITLSVVFFLKPNLIHKRKKHYGFNQRHLSHRGGGGEKLEGTMSAFTNAVDCGTDILEMDVRLTSDDVVVVFHDETLQRCCGVPDAVIDTRYEDLPPLKPPLDLYYRKGHTTYDDDTRILTLREVFQRFTYVPVMIEVKGTQEQLVRKVSDMITEFDRADRTIWGSENKSTSTLMYKQTADIPIFFSYKGGLLMLLWFYTGLLPFIRLRETFLVAPMPSIELDPQNGFDLHGFGRFKVWLTDKLFMRSSLFGHLSRRGINTFLFVLNKDSEYKRAFHQLKTTGVITDFPTSLSAYLKSAPQTSLEADTQTSGPADSLLKADIHSVEPADSLLKTGTQTSEPTNTL